MNHAMHEGLPWLTLFSLGALHGLNPGMGWLFAVALGLQEREGRAVWRALPPLAAGHALAVGLALLVLIVLGSAIPARALSLIMGASLWGLACTGCAGTGTRVRPGCGPMRVSSPPGHS